MKSVFCLLLFVPILASAESPNTTVTPDWYYDTAMGLSNGVAKAINIIPYVNMDKAETWTKEHTVNKGSELFETTSNIGAATTMHMGGKLVAKVVNVFKPLPKPKANQEDLDKLVKDKANKSDLDKLVKDKANQEDLDKVITKQADDDARRLAAAQLREAEKINTNKAADMGLTKPKPVDLTISED